MKITEELRGIWKRCQEKAVIGDLKVVGYFANGDFWCGEKSNEPGYWIAYDTQDRPYETLEVPRSLPIFTMGFTAKGETTFEKFIAD